MTYRKVGERAGKQGVDKLNWGAKTEISRRKDLIKVKENTVGNKELEKNAVMRNRKRWTGKYVERRKWKDFRLLGNILWILRNESMVVHIWENWEGNKNEKAKEKEENFKWILFKVISEPT